ncbi:MAG: hypothetical protein H6713_34000 [Myxococcales bacterium]|nr:hypothetical protein [Myxococcales bacterium]MCB9754978.1 hypothetical protein [Myxococcales bacterium]
MIADRSIHVPSVVETLEAGGDFPARVLDSAEDERAAVGHPLRAADRRGEAIEDLDELRPEFEVVDDQLVGLDTEALEESA